MRENMREKGNAVRPQGDFVGLASDDLSHDPHAGARPATALVRDGMVRLALVMVWSV